MSLRKVNRNILRYPLRIVSTFNVPKRFSTAKSSGDVPKPQVDQKQVQKVFDYSFGEKPYAAMSAGEKVVEGGKDTFYTFVIIGGIALTGFVGYVVFRELFSRETPNGIYTEALKMCRRSEELQILLGTPIKGYGEESRRGRRWLIAHDVFTLDGVKCMRIQFHLKGPISQGLVNLEVRKDEFDKYAYRYLFVETSTSSRPVVLIDNRNK